MTSTVRLQTWWVGLLALVLLAATSATAQAPAPPAGRPLSLEEAIRLALAQHPAIRAAAEGRNAADARVPQAFSSFLPRVDVDAGARRQQGFTSSINRFFTTSSYSTNVTLNQKLYDFGKTGARVDEAKATLRVAEEELERVRQEIALNVKLAYFDLLQAQRLVKVAEAAVERAELNLKSARGFFEVGAKPKSDVTKAEVEVANARVALIRSRNAVRLAQTTLANALGVEAEAPIAVQDILAFEPVPVDPAQLLTEAFKGRPELRQAKARVEVTRFLLRQATTAYFPDLDGNAAYGATNREFPLREVWELGFTFSWNLFEGFLTQSKVREARATLEAARADLNTLELQVRLEVDQAYLALLEADERISATAKGVESAQENLRLAQGRYAAGVGTILELADAQEALTNAEADQIRALTDHKLARARLDRALGRSERGGGE